MLVVDASVVVAALVDGGAVGEWAADLLASSGLAAPHLMPVEVADVLRRAEIDTRISSDLAAMAHADLDALRVDLFSYGAVADRAWALRANLRSYDAFYVALAERLGLELATLDERLTRAPGTSCRFVLPPAG